MRSALLLLLAVPLGGCAFSGSLVHGGTVATGAAAGAAIGGVPGAAIGSIVGFYGGDLAAEQVSGTRSVRVGPNGKVSSPAGSGLTGAITQASGINSMNGILWIIAILAFLHFGGLAWLRKQISDREKSAADTDGDRIAHKARTAALEADNARMRKELDELWDRVPPKG